MANIDRTIGKLEGIVERLENAAEAMEARLTIVEKERSEERGGRKMLMLLGAGVATTWGIIGSYIGSHIGKWVS